MPKFIVTQKEIWGQGVRIEAKDSKGAIKKVADREGDVAEGLFEYNHTLGPDTWTVEEVKEKEAK